MDETKLSYFFDMYLLLLIDCFRFNYTLSRCAPLQYFIACEPAGRISSACEQALVGRAEKELFSIL